MTDYWDNPNPVPAETFMPKDGTSVVLRISVAGDTLSLEPTEEHQTRDQTKLLVFLGQLLGAGEAGLT